jgi:hypothetical protein
MVFSNVNRRCTFLDGCANRCKRLVWYAFRAVAAAKRAARRRLSDSTWVRLSISMNRQSLKAHIADFKI